MRAVRSCLAWGAERLQELFAVVGELEDGVAVVVDDPHVLLPIVRADVYRVRTLHHLVPLRPRLYEIAGGVEHHDRVLPSRIDAHPPLPRLLRVVWILTWSAGPRRAGRWTLRRVAERRLTHRKRQARSDVGNRTGRGPRHGGQLASLDHVDTVGTLRENALH